MYIVIISMAIEYESEGQLRGMLVHELKTKKDPTDSLTQELMQAWTQSLERRSEAAPDSEGHIHHQLEHARLYAEAGFSEEALETFESAWEQAWRDFPELATEIAKEKAAYKDSLKG